MFNLDDCFALITSRSAKIFSEVLEKELRPFNVTRSQWIAMYYIYVSEIITQRELADKLCVKEPTLARLLQKMENDGIVCRSNSTSDKRMKYLTLTEKGKAICFKLVPVVEKYKDDIVSGIDDCELQIFKKVLDKMTENALNMEKGIGKVNN
jgi:MarR family transcriptional regulator, transcriptional regulator for hemolysin